jgi:Trk-type K+ transport system membrane component
MMLFSAFSFTFHLNLFSCLREIDWRSIFTRNRNEKQRSQNVFMYFVSNVKRAFSKVKWRKLLSTEFKLYIIFLFFFCVMFWLSSGLSPFNAVFHVVDMSSSCGLGLIPFNDLGELAKVLTVVIMFVGPMSFS